MILTADDFKGALTLPESKYIDVDYYIERYENEYLKRILGVDLYNQFIIDPENILIEKIYYPFDLCIGLKEVLIRFVFCEYNQALQSQNTVVGNVVNKNENSETTGGYLVIKQTFNEAVKHTKIIQKFLHDHKDDEAVSITQTLFENVQFAQVKPYDTTITIGATVIPARKYVSPYQVAAIISAYVPDIKFQQSNNAIKFYSETNLSGQTIVFDYNLTTLTLTFGDFTEQEKIYSKFDYTKFNYIIF